MKLYAIEIKQDDLELIVLLNQGVTPVHFAGTPTYFVFDAEWNSEMKNEIISEQEMIDRYEMYGKPHIIALR